MASTDARPVPQKGVAYRVTFPIFDADGDLVTGAAGLDSEVSKDAGTFADCTNEATEIATSSGIYYLDLTSTEMNADTVAVIVKTSTSGAKTTVLVFNPEEAGDVRVNVTQIEGADPTDTIRDSVVDDATRIDASALNTLSGHDPGETIMGATDLGTGAGLTSLASAANLATVAGYIDTEVAAIKTVTDALPDAGALTSLATASALATVDGVVDAIKAKTDSLTFTTAGQVDANIQYINDVALTGDGQPGTEFGV